MADQHLKRKTGGRGVGERKMAAPLRPTGAGARSGQNAYARRVRPDKEGSCCWRLPPDGGERAIRPERLRPPRPARQWKAAAVAEGAINRYCRRLSPRENNDRLPGMPEYLRSSQPVPLGPDRSRDRSQPRKEITG